MKLFNRELTLEQIINFCKVSMTEKTNNGCKECLLVDAANDLVTEIERLQKIDTTNWIPAEDRLPEITHDNCSESVLIAVHYGTDMPYEKPTICCGYRLGDEWWSYSAHGCNEIGEWQGDIVTHWRPLFDAPINKHHIDEKY